MSMITPLFTAFLVSLIAVGGTRKIAHHFGIGALPSTRKIHTDFKPLLGGLGIFAGLLIGVFTANLLQILPFEIWKQQQFYWGGLGVILLTGLLECKHNTWRRGRDSNPR